MNVSNKIDQYVICLKLFPFLVLQKYKSLCEALVKFHETYLIPNQ